jgi:hypothetical protein
MQFPAHSQVSYHSLIATHQVTIPFWASERCLLSFGILMDYAIPSDTQFFKHCRFQQPHYKQHTGTMQQYGVRTGRSSWVNYPKLCYQGFDRFTLLSLNHQYSKVDYFGWGTILNVKNPSIPLRHGFFAAR